MKFRRKESKPALAKEAVLVTDQTNMKLVACAMKDDGSFTHKAYGTSKLVKNSRIPHVLEISSSIFPSKLMRFIVPRKVRVRVYTVRKESEVSHDPNNDEFDPKEKRKLESVLMLQGKMMKADFAGKIAEGMKPKMGLMEYIPWFVVAIISVIAMLSMGEVI